MNALAKEIEKNLHTWEKLGIDCFGEHKTGEPDKPHRAYLCSKVLGGTLANNNGEGWIPIYPAEKENYPVKGKWFSPGSRTWKPTDWKTAVIASLDPGTYQGMDEVGQKTAIDRAAELRDPFRAQVVIAMIRGLK